MGSASVNTDERIAKYLEMVADQIRCGFLKFSTLRIHEQREESISFSLDTYKNFQEQKDEKEFVEKVNEEQLIDRIIDHLNAMLKKDPIWINNLVRNRAKVSESTQKEYGISERSGLIGFLETLIGPTHENGRIAVLCEAPFPGEHPQIIFGFKRWQPMEKAPAKPPAPWE